MSLGAGVFLGCLFIGCVYLYLNTREVWNWKKILLISAGLLVVLILSFLLLIFWDKLFNEQADISSGKNYSGLIQSYGGIAIDNSIADVEFKFGKLKSEGKTKNGNFEIYVPSKESALTIFTEVSGKTVDFIGVDCNKSNDSFNGIKCGDTSEQILKKYKDKVKIWCPSTVEKDEDPYRIYDIVDFGTRYYLQKNVVAHIRFHRQSFMRTPKTLRECETK